MQSAKRVVRMIHFLGVALFLGSIATFIVASSVGTGGPARNLAVSRQIIHSGTWALTVPGLLTVLVSGTALILGVDGSDSALDDVDRVAGGMRGHAFGTSRGGVREFAFGLRAGLHA